MAFKDPERARAYHVAYRKINKERIAARQRDYAMRNPGKHTAAVRRWRATPNGARKEKAARYLRTYGITLESAEALLASQSGGCAICFAELTLFSRRTCVDHDHETKAVRGLLCHRCNQQLGQFEAWPDFATHARAYLDRAHAP